MQIPTIEQCYHLMCEMKMMDHIVRHSLQVCRVATFLAQNLNADSITGSIIDLIRAAALLHDITKTRSFKTEENHAADRRPIPGRAGLSRGRRTRSAACQAGCIPGSG